MNSQASVISTTSSIPVRAFETRAAIPDTPRIVIVTCPLCRKQGTKVFREDVIQERAKNPANIVRMLFSKEFCDHVFIAYIDKDMSMKGYEAIDFIP